MCTSPTFANVVPNERSTHVMAVCCQSTGSSVVQQGACGSWLNGPFEENPLSSKVQSTICAKSAVPHRNCTKSTRTSRRKKNNEAATCGRRRGCGENQNVKLSKKCCIWKITRTCLVCPFGVLLHANAKREYLRKLFGNQNVALKNMCGTTWNCLWNASSRLQLGRRTLWNGNRVNLTAHLQHWYDYSPKETHRSVNDPDGFSLPFVVCNFLFFFKIRESTEIFLECFWIGTGERESGSFLNVHSIGCLFVSRVNQMNFRAHLDHTHLLWWWKNYILAPWGVQVKLVESMVFLFFFQCAIRPFIFHLVRSDRRTTIRKWTTLILWKNKDVVKTVEICDPMLCGFVFVLCKSPVDCCGNMHHSIHCLFDFENATQWKTMFWHILILLTQRNARCEKTIQHKTGCRIGRGHCCDVARRCTCHIDLLQPARHLHWELSCSSPLGRFLLPTRTENSSWTVDHHLHCF